MLSLSTSYLGGESLKMVINANPQGRFHFRFYRLLHNVGKTQCVSITCLVNPFWNWTGWRNHSLSSGVKRIALFNILLCESVQVTSRNLLLLHVHITWIRTKPHFFCILCPFPWAFCYLPVNIYFYTKNISQCLCWDYFIHVLICVCDWW